MNADTPSLVLNPEPRILNPHLPPSTRDFEIHRAHLVEHVSTRSLADKHHISQTRVRQIVHRVTQWLIATLPLNTEAELEREALFARRLAADQLNHQIERLETLWSATCDPKYFRQQARAIISLGRLGVVPGAIDAVAADAEQRGADIPVCQDGEMERQSDRENECGSQAENIIPPSLSRSVSPSSAPPPGDCSLSSPPQASDRQFTPPERSASVKPATSSGESLESMQLQLEGLEIMERRLLTLIEGVAPNDHEARQSLEATLAKVRAGRDEVVTELRLSRHAPGASLRTTESPPPDSAAGAPLNKALDDHKEEATQLAETSDASGTSTIKFM